MNPVAEPGPETGTHHGANGAGRERSDDPAGQKSDRLLWRCGA